MATTALPLTLVLGPPFALKVEPTPAMLAPGGKARLKVVATRRGGYKGPITVELRKLPAGVTAAKATIPADKTMIEMDVAADGKAAPGEKADVEPRHGDGPQQPAKRSRRRSPSGCRRNSHEPL